MALEMVNLHAIRNPETTVCAAANVDAGDKVFFVGSEAMSAWYWVHSASLTAQEQVRWLLYRDGVRPFMALLDPAARVRVIRADVEEAP